MRAHVLLISFLFLLLNGHAAFAFSLQEKYRGGLIERTLLHNSDLQEGFTNYTANTFEQNIGESAELGTFAQRYWMDLSSYTGTKKALLYIGGEGPARSSPTGYAARYGRTQGMAMFTLEHRYYGESLPYPLTNRTALIENLNVESALRDLRNFQVFAETQLLGAEPGSVKWLLVGGSYAGALAVWFRILYPFAATASWSSSGVILAVLDFRDYDRHIASVLSPECVNAVRAAQDEFLTLWERDSTELKQTYGIPQDFDRTAVAAMLADAVAGPVQYGHKETMCHALTQDDGTNYSEPLRRFFKMSDEINGVDFKSSCGFSTACLNDPNRSSEWGATLPWMYQTCSQLAYFQVGFPGSLRLEEISLDYYLQQCRDLFGDAGRPAVDAFNRYYGGLEPATSNVFAAQGSDDPFIMAGLRSSLSPNYETSVATCDGCGHCGDLHINDNNSAIVEQQSQLASFFDAALASIQHTQIVKLKGNWTAATKSYAIADSLHDALSTDFIKHYDAGARLSNVTFEATQIVFTLTVLRSDLNEKSLDFAEKYSKKSVMHILDLTNTICDYYNIPHPSSFVFESQVNHMNRSTYILIILGLILSKVIVFYALRWCWGAYKEWRYDYQLYDHFLSLGT